MWWSVAALLVAVQTWANPPRSDVDWSISEDLATTLTRVSRAADARPYITYNNLIIDVQQLWHATNWRWSGAAWKPVTIVSGLLDNPYATTAAQDRTSDRAPDRGGERQADRPCPEKNLATCYL